jgi:hypothetical protein
MKIYIAGAITNNPFYKEQFAEAEKELTALGWQVINPSKNPGTSYKDYIDTGLFELMKCDAVYFLDGWEKSDGANLEYVYAVTTGMDIYISRKQALKLETDMKTRIKNKSEGK